MPRESETGERRRSRVVETLPIVLVTALVTALIVSVCFYLWTGWERPQSAAYRFVC